MLQGSLLQLRRDPLPDPELVVGFLHLVWPLQAKRNWKMFGGDFWTNMRGRKGSMLHNRRLFLVKNQRNGHKAGESMR